MDLEKTANTLEENGQSAVLRRFIGQQRGRQDVAVKVSLTKYAPAELSNNIAQGDQKAILSNREITAKRWPGPPRRGDLLILKDGTTLTVEACDTQQLGEIAYRYDLQLRGA